MAAITVTVASVVKGTGAVTGAGIAGETITAGCPLYLKSSDSRYWLADANVSAETSTVVGISLHASLAGQPIVFITSGLVTIGSGAMVAASTHYLHTNPGAISDGHVTGYTSILGVSSTTDILYVSIFNSGYQHA